MESEPLTFSATESMDAIRGLMVEQKREFNLARLPQIAGHQPPDNGSVSGAPDDAEYADEIDEKDDAVGSAIHLSVGLAFLRRYWLWVIALAVMAPIAAFILPPLARGTLFLLGTCFLIFPELVFEQAKDALQGLAKRLTGSMYGLGFGRKNKRLM